MKLNPYLNFNGNCKEAFDFYRSVFGGEFVMMSQFKDMPPQEGITLTEEDKENIMHISLPVGDFMLMGSDTFSNSPADMGNNIAISIAADSEAQTDDLFGKLSEGGTVVMPVEKTFWNSYFGMCIDKFGISWMIGYDYPTE